MEKLWFGIANLIAAFVLAPCAILFARQIKIFEKNKKRGYATIVGYDDEDHAKWDDPLVNLDVDEKKKTYTCKSRHLNAQILPRGTRVEVEYCTYKAFGREWYEVHMADPQYAPHSDKRALIVMYVMIGIFITVFITMFVLWKMR